MISSINVLACPSEAPLRPLPGLRQCWGGWWSDVCVYGGEGQLSLVYVVIQLVYHRIRFFRARRVAELLCVVWVTFLADMDMIIYVHMHTLVVIFAFFWWMHCVYERMFLQYIMFVCLAFVCRPVITTLNSNFCWLALCKFLQDLGCAVVVHRL